ncbi:hypothetical protein L1049_008194 [Liquidambar formosana]|uniref:acylphosphatase n=1 Tax=Liquidambar formosana TaxID=63359 RepID=A0AAP0S2N2_LIQFO
MAATFPPLGHLTPMRGIRFPAFRSQPHHIWNHNNNAVPRLRLHLLPPPHHHLYYPPHLLPSLRSPFLHSPPPIRLLFGLCSPSFSSPLSSMTSPKAASNPPQSSPSKTVRVVIKGRVQGVFYRDWTVENAKELGLKGWVRNRRDGSVEALFNGNPDSVQEMEQRCRRGPPSAVVTGLEIFPSSNDPGTGFERKQTV